jgi:hypothetical protein
MAKTLPETQEAQSALDSARRFQEYKRHLQEQQDAFKKVQMEADGRTRAELDHSAAREAPAPGTNPLPDDAQPPLLRHRGEITATGTGDAVSIAPATAPPPRPELLTRREVADGTITESKCTGSATLELTVTSPAGTRQLYSDNYFKIPYSALNYTPQGILNPCSDMKGMRAHITYRPAKDHPEQGEIVEVQLRK